MVMRVIFKLHGFLTPDLDLFSPNLIYAWISFELGISLKGAFQNICRVASDLNCSPLPLSVSSSAFRG